MGNDTGFVTDIQKIRSLIEASNSFTTPLTDILWRITDKLEKHDEFIKRHKGIWCEATPKELAQATALPAEALTPESVTGWEHTWPPDGYCWVKLSSNGTAKVYKVRGANAYSDSGTPYTPHDLRGCWFLPITPEVYEENVAMRGVIAFVLKWVENGMVSGNPLSIMYALREYLK